MLLAYFDESGDSGQHNGSVTYTLGGLVIQDSDWPDVFDAVLGFRRDLRSTHGILLSDEVKATSLIRGGGDLKRHHIDPPQRRAIWEKHFDFLSTVDAVRAYSVVINKTKLMRWRNPRDISWEFALQRLHHATQAENETVMIIHDEGDDLAVRQIIRKARRLNVPGSAFGLGNLGNQPIRRIIDDAVPRNSQHSFLIQFADLIAYAGFRTVIPPGRSAASVCSSAMWDRLGQARWEAANNLARGQMGRPDQPGVVVWPK